MAYSLGPGDHQQNADRVGRILAALGLFQAPADARPDDLEQRRRILKDTLLTGGDLTRSGHHNE